MTRVGWISGAGALALLALGLAAPASAALQREAPTGIAPATAAQLPAGAEAGGGAGNTRQSAIDACLNANEFGPATMVQAAADGFGDWLVWVEDRDGDLWSCNADGDGRVYMNVVVAGDLLEGRGGEFLHGERTAAAKDEDAGAEGASRDLCVGVAGLTQAVAVVATVPDGLGDSLVWLRLADGQLWMCDASADGKLFVFEPVGLPTEISEEPARVAAEAPDL